jgi:hypothetical protein
MPTMNREAWLTRYVVLLRPVFAQAGFPLPRAIQVSIGFPSKGGLRKNGACVGECWEDEEGVAHIFISPVLELDDIGHTLVHELLHAALPGDGHQGKFPAGMKALGLVGPPSESVAGAELSDRLAELEARLGPYPGTPIRTDEAPAESGGKADERIIEKLKKLLALATSDNIHEAAAAAAKAQELIERYRIDRALLEGDEKETRAGDDPIATTVLHRFNGSRVMTWILNLAISLGEQNAVAVYYSNAYPATIEGAGTERDLATVAYMVQYLIREVERLLKDAVKLHRREHGFPPGRTWANSFRNGAVATIADRLARAKEETRRKLLEEAAKPVAEKYREAIEAHDMDRLLELDSKPKTEPSYALARVEAAIARVEEQAERVDDWVKQNLRLRTGTSRSWGVDRDGYAAGRKAGERVNLSPRNPRLTSG